MPKFVASDLEENILSELEPLASEGVKIITYPDAFESSGKVYVADLVVIGFTSQLFEAPSFSPNIRCKPIQQQIRATIEMTILSKNLRTIGYREAGATREPIGAYYIIQRIRDILSGYRLQDDLGPLYLQSVEFAGRNKQGYFIYDMAWQFQYIQQTEVDLLPGFIEGDQIS
jgi:hypothetical protein